MKDKTKNILRGVGKFLLKVLVSIFKKKGLICVLMAISLIMFCRCVNGTMIVVKTPSKDLHISADSMRNVIVDIVSDTLEAK